MTGWWSLLWLVAEAAAQERWAGHQVTITTRKVPLLGTIETRQDVYMIADVVREGDSLVLTERPCTIGIRSGEKVRLSFNPAGVRRIPETPIRYTPEDGVYSGSWTGGWGERDVDGDGQPGFLVQVEAPVCDGTMSIATITATRGSAIAAAGGLDGNVRIALDRHILDTSNACLALVPKRSEETIDGWFSYRPTDATATCDSLLASGWPVRAR